MVRSRTRLAQSLGLGLLLASVAPAPPASAGPPSEQTRTVVFTPFETRGQASDLGMQDADLLALRDAWLAQRPARDASLTIRSAGIEAHADLEIDRPFAAALEQLWPAEFDIRVVGEGNHLTLDAGGYTLERATLRVDGGDFIIVGGGLTLSRSSVTVTRGSAYIGGAGTMVLRATTIQVHHGLHVGSRRIQAQASKISVKDGRFTMQDGARVLLSSAIISTRYGFAAAPRTAMIFSGLSRISSTSGELGFPPAGDIVCGSEASSPGTSCSYQDEREVLVLNPSNGSTRRMRRRSDILTAQWNELIEQP